MGSFVKRRAFIPVAEAPAEMPEGIEARYYTHKYGKFKEITQDNVKRIMKNLRSGRWESIFLSEEADEEGDYMQLESGGGFDVMFLDIQMDQPDGMETARLLRQRGCHGLLVFVTVLKELLQAEIWFP